MFPLHLAFAVVLITSPDGGADLPCSLTAMQSVALALEVLDPREQRYVFGRREEFEADLRLVRRRYADLRDAPLSIDVGRFPGRDVCREALDMNRSYEQTLISLVLDRGDWISQARADTAWLYSIWDLLYDAHCPYYYVTTRRVSLQRLRDAIGPHAYYAGTLPAPVPVWYFWRVD